MKLLREIYSLIEPSSTDKGASVMVYPNVYKEKKVGAKTKVTKQSVIFKSSGKDGKIYGRRTIRQK